MLLYCILLGALCIKRNDFRRDMGVVVRNALSKSGVSIKAAAIYMDMDHAQLSRQLNGEGHLSLTRLHMLPSTFWKWFSVLVAAEVGLPKEIRVGQKLRMARASMRPSRMERVS